MAQIRVSLGEKNGNGTFWPRPPRKSISQCNNWTITIFFRCHARKEKFSTEWYKCQQQAAKTAQNVKKEHFFVHPSVSLSIHLSESESGSGGSRSLPSPQPLVPPPRLSEKLNPSSSGFPSVGNSPDPWTTSSGTFQCFRTSDSTLNCSQRNKILTSSLNESLDGSAWLIFYHPMSMYDSTIGPNY